MTRPAGSSPLARGLLRGHAHQAPGRGIIPARAGFTRWVGLIGLTYRDHPRSRGVYTRPSFWTASPPGSSPLARGLPAAPPPPASGRGIIPARAGFTRAPPVASAGGPDHPRSRGVYIDLPGEKGTQSGSSPLARGLQAVLPVGTGEGRIIPARAGFTSARARPPSGRPDHPRSRGVYLIWLVVTWYPSGSSPLARGLPRGRDRYADGHRIIPARAGFTTPGRCRSGRCADHPRSRGVYLGPSRGGRPRGGSSPLARGLRVSGPGHSGLLGIIPARAGFT